MLAELSGALATDGNCLFVIESGHAYLPVWPSAYWLDGETLRSGRRAVASVGESVLLTGGFLPTEQVVDRLTNPILDECYRNTVFWVGG